MRRILFLLTGFFLFINVYSQNKFTISGNVVDENGEPLIGVNVIEKGTTTGTVTDLDGTYTINVSGPDAILVFSFVGYLSEEIPVNNQKEINLSLIPDLQEIDEIVVIGYGSVKKGDLTGSVEVVNTEEINRRPILSSEEVLQGKASGVFVASSTGAPGSPMSIRIRGVGTPNNADPLYIVDGMPIKDATFGKNDNPSGINFLNPSDIESIQILKDASAAAIYGTRGANGVIIITTKKGKAGKPVVSFNSYYGSQELPKKLDVLNAQQFATLYNEINGELFNPDSIPYLQTTDWQDEIFRRAPMYNSQLSVSGGNENSNYYTSFNRFSQEGIIKESSYIRNSFRVNSEHKVNRWLKIGENLTLTHFFRKRQNEQGLGASGIVGSPIAAAFQADPTENIYDPETEHEYLEVTSTISNPVGILERKFYHYTTNRIQGNAFAEMEFIKNLVFKINGGIDRSWGYRKEVWPEYFVGPNDANNNTLLTTEHEDWYNYLVESTVNYSFNLGNNHVFNLMTGVTQQEEVKSREVGTSYLPTKDENMLYHSARASVNDIIQLGGNPLPWALRSMFGRINYSFMDKYLFTGSIRHDGSSRFGSEKRWGTFPAASLAWKISEEDFMERFGNISQLKVRTGWGKTGNQNIVPFGYNTTASYQPDAGLPGPVTYFGTPQVTEYPALFILGVANQNVGWETTTTINIGLDLSMWDNRLLATIDVYDKTTTDLLLDVPLADMFAVTYGNYIGNAGEVNNKGLDLTLSYRNKLGDLDYEIGGNFSTVKNEVVSLEGGAPLTSGTEPPVRMIEGKPIGAFWGWVHEGIFESEEEIQNSPEQLRRTGVGDIKFKDLNKDGVIDDDDQHVIGYALPDFSYGLSLGLSYRNFDLNILTQGIYGNSVYNNVKSKALYNLNVNTNVSTDLLNYYGRILDDGSVITDTDVPRLGRDNNNNDRNSTYFLEDGSYLRVKSASLSYSFSDLLRGIGLSDMRVYFTAQNLFTFTKYSGYNPEIGVSTAWDSNPLAFGIDNAVYPQPRTFLFGLDISF